MTNLKNIFSIWRKIKWRSLSEAMCMVNEFEKRLSYAKENTSLPDSPNVKQVEEFVMSVNRRAIDAPAAFTIRFGHEYLLYMYKGKLLPVNKEERGKIHSVFTEQVKRHSQKPEVSFEIINRLYPNAKKIELYARTEREGFDCWGNEVAGYKGA